MTCELDDEARKLLGGSVIVTRDGAFVFIYAWHEDSAQEAERVVKHIMEDEKLVGQVHLMRWHPLAEEWKDAEEPLPDDEAARAQEMRENEAEGVRESALRRVPMAGRNRAPPHPGHSRLRRASCGSRACR